MILIIRYCDKSLYLFLYSLPISNICCHDEYYNSFIFHYLHTIFLFTPNVSQPAAYQIVFEPDILTTLAIHCNKFDSPSSANYDLQTRRTLNSGKGRKKERLKPVLCSRANAHAGGIIKSYQLKWRTKR